MDIITSWYRCLRAKEHTRYVHCALLCRSCFFGFEGITSFGLGVRQFSPETNIKQHPSNYIIPQTTKFTLWIDPKENDFVLWIRRFFQANRFLFFVGHVFNCFALIRCCFFRIFVSLNSSTNWITCTVMPVCRSKASAFHFFPRLFEFVCVLFVHFIYRDVAFTLTHHLYAFVTICTMIQFTFAVTTVSDVCKTVGCMLITVGKRRKNTVSERNLKGGWWHRTTIATTQTRGKNLPCHHS